MGDILYGSRRTYLKKVALADFDGITANTTFVIKANEKLIEPILLVHLMLSYEFTEYSIKNSRGSVNPYINWKDIADFEFLLPPKSEQKRLAELLWAADEVMEKEKKEREKVEELLETDCANTLGQCYNGQYESLNQSFIKISDVIAKERFEVGKLETEQYQSQGKYPIIDQSKTFIAGYSDLDILVFKGSLPVIVFGDHTTIVKFVDFPFILGADGTKIIKANDKKVTTKFLFYAIKNLHIIPQGYRRHFSILKELEIPSFSIEKQNECVSRWDKLEELSNGIIQQIELSQQIKQELIKKVF
jgi:restriction endonuclease S subunit